MAKKGKHLAKNLKNQEDIPSAAPEKQRSYDKKQWKDRAAAPREAEEAAPKKRSKVKVILTAVLVVILIVALLGTGIMIYALSRINRDHHTDYLPAEEETFDKDDMPVNTEGLDPNQVEWGSVDTIQGEHVYNLLLIGQDRREGEGRARSDSMIIVSINTKTNKIHLVSLLRDLYVQIPGYSDNRINAAYMLGGMELLDDTIEENFGVHIDGNIEVDFEGFIRAVDIVGGIDLELTSSEAYVINSETGSWLGEGMNHLNGEEALTYARIRKLDSDFGRTERQRNVLTALAAEVRSASLTELTTLVNEILPLVTTDLSNTQILKYAAMVLPMISDSDNLETGCVPQDDAYSNEYIREMSVLLPDLPKCREYLQELLYGE